MKRAFTQKIGSVPSCAIDNEGVSSFQSKDNPQALYPELTRRVRTSATTIGLAIAMAASGMVLSQKEQKVMAAEEFGIANQTEALSSLENSPTEKESSATNTPVTSEASISSAASTNSLKPQSVDTTNVSEVAVPTAAVQEPTPVAVESKTSNSVTETVVVTSVKQPKVVANLTNPDSGNQLPAKSLIKEPVDLIPQPSAAEVLATSTPKVIYQVKSGDTLETIAQSYDTSVTQLAKLNSLDTKASLQTNQGLIVPSSDTSVDAQAPEAEKNLTSQPESVVPDSQANNSIPSDSIAEEPNANELQAEIETLKEETEVQTLVAQAIPEAVPITVPDPDTVATTQPSSAIPTDNQSEVATTGAIEIPVPKPENYTVVKPTWGSTSSSRLEIQASPNQTRRISTQTQSSTPLPIRQGDSLPLETGAIEIPVPAPATNFVPNQRRGRNLATAPLGTDDYNSNIPTSPSQQQLKDQFLNPSANVTYTWPVNAVVTSGFGKRWGRLHAGIDLAAAIGTPVRAAAPGIVIRSGWVGGYGNLVEIKHPNGSVTRYGHNSQLIVQVGQEVQQGDVISMSGNTGRSTGPHVHFEIRPDGKQAVNPMPLLPRRA
ncbi:peptidoglycan DD-metalloendopeptidase family protein [Merismopedia glauca]|uniref:LysM domain-containing protein n=1 Tax=Merismopedia glauca CCAP 1448/3 TaxID=1296344 RepID=A0A2T1C5Y4_9CYAN|nr:peptidoglycan DD-metalloendopeptidase family protein [Merismopedia glauca]PSB03558.1 hypothetical protein C7B64_07865 [Merismopedia glauca CCAP 1448/3]